MTSSFTESFFSDFSKGLSRDCYYYLGNHDIGISQDGNPGLRTVSFAVWAPNAKAVKVYGDFNNWGAFHDPCCDMMQLQNGIWYTEIPNVQQGDLYKYFVVHQDGSSQLKNDPFSIYSELRPGTSSVVYDLSHFEWQDAPWLATRAQTDYLHSPINIYEMHIGSWFKGSDDLCNYRTIADQLVGYLQDMNYTHVEFMPLSEYPQDGTWGYQIGNYYSLTSRYGTPEDFKYLINRLHEAGIGVILDWIPGYFCKDAAWLQRFDGTWQFEYSIENFRENPYTGTSNFDLGKGEVRSFLISNAIFWLKEYHIDGLRVDSVANILYLDYEKAHSVQPKNIYGGQENLDGVEFLRELNIAVHSLAVNPLMIAEDSSSWPMVTKPVYLGGLGFDLKWNVNWKNNTLEYMRSDPVYRSALHTKMTYGLVNTFAENFILPISHKDVVHGKKTLLGKMFGTEQEQFAAFRAYLIYMMTHPGKKMLFMGSEFGQLAEWRYYESFDWDLLQNPSHSKIKEYVRAMNYIYKQERSLYELEDRADGFMWIDADNASQNVFSFIRRGYDADDILLIVCNFSSISYPEYKIGVPRFADYHEIISSDDARYGGTGVVHEQGVRPRPIPWNGQPFHISIALPSYTAKIFRPIFPKRMNVSVKKRLELQKKE